MACLNLIHADWHIWESPTSGEILVSDESTKKLLARDRRILCCDHGCGENSVGSRSMKTLSQRQSEWWQRYQIERARIEQQREKSK